MGGACATAMNHAPSLLTIPPLGPVTVEVGASRHSSLRGLFVLNSLNVGGSETKTVRVANALWRRGVSTGIATLNEPGELLSALDPGVPVWRLQRRGKFSIRALANLRRLIRTQRPTAVLAMNLYPCLYVALSMTGVGSRTAAFLNTTAFAKGDEWRQLFYSPFLRKFDALIYGCELQRVTWRPQWLSRGPTSTVIYNGVDTDHFAPVPEGVRRAERQRYSVQNAFVIGAVGRLAPEKNHAALIAAVAELRRRSIDAHLLLIGEGALRSQLETYAAQLGVRNHVTFAGLHRDVRPLLAAMDVFVLPSTHIETFSNAALEAMAMGCPVVLSEVGGAAEMVRDAVEGFTIDLSDLQAGRLAPLLARLQADPSLREQLGARARARVEREFSLRIMTDRYESLLGPAPTYAIR